MFLPAPRRRPRTGARTVRFPTEDGLELAGHLPASAGARTRVGRARLLPRVSERSLELSALRRPPPRPRLRHLHLRLPEPRRQRSDPDYEPAPVGRPTTRSATSAAALAYLRSRPDHDPAGFGLFGVSRGGGTALVVAAAEPRRLGRRSPTARSRPAARCSPTSSAGPRSTCAARCSWRVVPALGLRASSGWAGRRPLAAAAELPVPRHRDARSPGSRPAPG